MGIPTDLDLDARWRPHDPERRPTCGRIFRDEECRKRGPHYCKPRADKVIAFFSEVLAHYRKPHVGQPFVPKPWQEFEILRPLFGEVVWSPEFGCYVRRYRIAHIVMARKGGKSALASAILLYMLIGDDEQASECYCLDPATRVLDADLCWRPVGEMSEGDEIVGFDEFASSGGRQRKLRRAKVESTTRKVLPCYAVTFEDGRQVIASERHTWLTKVSHKSNTQRWVETQNLTTNHQVRSLGQPWEYDTSREAGYLAGLFDGEASIHAPYGTQGRRGSHGGLRISFAQHEGAVLTETTNLLRDLGFEPRGPRFHRNSGVAYLTLQGAYECLRFLGQVRPLRLLENVRATDWWEGVTPHAPRQEVPDPNNGFERVAWVEYVGEREVVAIGTSTQTLFAEGLFSHNSAAADTKQAGKVFEPADQMRMRSPILSKRLKHNKQSRRIYDERTASIYEIITADAKGELGHNPHCFNLDEVLAQRDASLWEAMTTAIGARMEELLFTTTTETNDPSSFGADLIDEAARVMYDPASAPHIFAFVRKMPKDDDELQLLRDTFPDHPDLPVSLDVFDERNWAWPNPALDDFKSREAMRRQSADAQAEPQRENAFRQFQMNQRVSQQTRWMPLHLWDASATQRLITEESLYGRRCYAGLDLAATTDLAAVAYLFPPTDDDELYDVVFRAWTPQAMAVELDQHLGGKFDVWRRQGLITVTPGDVIDYDAIYDQIDDDAQQFEVVQLGYDPWRAVKTIQDLQAAGMDCVPVRQGYQTMSPTMGELMRMVRKRTINTGGHPVARWNADSLDVQADHAGNIKPTKPERSRSSRRIDLVVALLNALYCEQQHVETPKPELWVAFS